MKDYSVYNITPPNIYVLADGPNVYLVGMNETEKNTIKTVFENLIYDAEIAFYYNNDPIDDETLGWTEVVASKADFVIVNIDKVSALEQYIIDAVLTNDQDSAIVIYYSKSGLENPMARLIANYGQNVMFDLKDIEDFLKMLFEDDK